VPIPMPFDVACDPSRWVSSELNPSYESYLGVFAPLRENSFFVRVVCGERSRTMSFVVNKNDGYRRGALTHPTSLPSAYMFNSAPLLVSIQVMPAPPPVGEFPAREQR
jgi:hypothetical protein